MARQAHVLTTRLSVLYPVISNKCYNYNFCNKNFKKKKQSKLCEAELGTILSLWVSGIHRQVLKHIKVLSERLKKTKEKKKIKESVLVAESAYNLQKTQFGLAIKAFGFFST